MPLPTPKRRKTSEYNDLKDPERRRLEEAQASASTPIFLPNLGSNGVGKFAISERDARVFRILSDSIVTRVKSGVTWGEGKDRDPRRRMYGFLPGQREALLDAGIKIQKEGATDSQEHDDCLEMACVDLEFLSKKTESIISSVLYLDRSIKQALKSLTQQVHSVVPDQYKKFATMDQLVAVQPNIHNGASYLPAHLDFPRHDGFGVLIVTIGILGSGTIVLMDDGDEGQVSQSFCFDIDEGEAYILCGDARNKALHGVLSDSSQRETLNLRYGLHSKFFAFEEIDRHWLED